MRTIMGLMGRATGRLDYNGVNLLGMRSDRIARQGIAICPEDRGIFPSLSVAE